MGTKSPITIPPPPNTTPQMIVGGFFSELTTDVVPSACPAGGSKTCIDRLNYGGHVGHIAALLQNSIPKKQCNSILLAVVPRKAVVEVSKKRTPIGGVGCCDARMI